MTLFTDVVEYYGPFLKVQTPQVPVLVWQRTGFVFPIGKIFHVISIHQLYKGWIAPANWIKQYPEDDLGGFDIMSPMDKY